MVLDSPCNPVLKSVSRCGNKCAQCVRVETVTKSIEVLWSQVHVSFNCGGEEGGKRLSAERTALRPERNFPERAQGVMEGQH